MKTMTSMSIDVDVYLELKQRKANISALVNGFLRSWLKLPVEQQKEVTVDLIDVEIANHLSEIERLNKKKLKGKKHKQIRIDDQGKRHEEWVS